MTKGRRAADLFALAAALVLLSYSTLRAVRIPITGDEAVTYELFVSHPLGDILTLHAPQNAANNHVLSSLAAKASSQFLGKTPFALRLPILAAHASFLLFSWLLMRGRASPLVAAAVFVLLNANPLLLELFALCRGYGLALGFLMPALFLALRSFDPGAAALRDRLLALVLLGFGSLAQLVLLDVLTAVLAAFLVVHALERQWRALASLAVTGALFVTLLVTQGMLLRSSGQLYAGGSTGFWADTVSSLASFTIYSGAGARGPAALALFAAVLLLVAHVAGAACRSPRLLAALSFLDVAALATIAQHRLLGTPYLTGRLAVFFVPLLAVALLEALAALEGRAVIAVRGAALALALASGAHLARVADLSVSRLSWFDADALNVLDDLAARPRPVGRPLQLGVTWYLEPALSFYRATRGIDWLDPVTRDAPWGPFDVVALTFEDEEEAQRRGFTILRRFPRTGIALYRSPAYGTHAREEAVRLVPVVVDVESPSGRYLTRLVLTNRGAKEARVTLTYVGSMGTGLGTAQTALPAGVRLEIPSVLEYLRTKGLPIAASGPQAGTLLVAAEGLSSPEVLSIEARTSAGKGGVSYGAIDPAAEPPRDRLVVGPLRAGDRERSSVAVFCFSSRPAIVRVVAEGDGKRVVVAEHQWLSRFGWRQFNNVLAEAGVAAGFVTIERVEGEGFVGAYGVVTDNATNDGAFLLGR